MFIPLKLKDAVTTGNILGGLASAVAAMEGSLEWACVFMLIAWIFDMFDGTVARLTGGGNKFGEVFDNLADLVSYSVAPSFIIYAAYHAPRELGGAGWPIWAAGLLAALPTVFGCIRFTRNNVKDFLMHEFHLGLPRPMHALFIACMLTSHLFRGPGMTDPASALNPALYGLGAAAIAGSSLLVLGLRPYHSRPRKESHWLVYFFTAWFLVTAPLGLLTGLAAGQPRIFFDVLFFNFSLYVWLQHLIIPAGKKREARQVVRRLIREWNEQIG
jgi:CDP-diacylglycerol--serine O-phosphatidyltransferase